MENFIGQEESNEQNEELNPSQKSYNKENILKKLDKYIQDSLDKYKPKENPDPSLYENTTEKEKDLIISRKSTIPDLVIWNKKFNKNECFIGANTNKQNDFPRFTFYLRLNKDKNGKVKYRKNNKTKEKKSKKNKNKNAKNNNKNIEDEEDIKEAKAMDNNMNNKIDEINKEMKKMNLNENIVNKNEININNNINNEGKKEKKKKNKLKSNRIN